MDNIVSKGFKTFATILLVSLISFFVVVSFNMIEIGLFSEDIGYDVRGQVEKDGDIELLYKYYIKPGIDQDAAKYEKEGYILSKRPIIALVGEGKDAKDTEIGVEVYGKKSADAEVEFLYKYYNQEGNAVLTAEYEEKKVELRRYSFRSDVEKGPATAISILSQLCCLFIIIAFIYNELWKIGNKDFEAIRLRGYTVNKLKGLYIGLIGIAPAFIFLTFALITKNSIMANSSIAIFTFSNAYAFETIFAITNGAIHWADVQWWQAIGYYGVLTVVPIISCVSYIIGVKDISLGEKFIYKNSKKNRRRA